MPDDPRLQTLPAELQDLLLPADFRAFLLDKFRHHLDRLAVDFQNFLLNVFRDRSMITLILKPASRGRTPDEAKSHTAALITQFFFTLIDPDSDEATLYDNILGPSPDEPTASMSNNQTPANSSHNSNKVLGSDRPIFAKNISRVLTVKDRILVDEYMVFAILQSRKGNLGTFANPISFLGASTASNPSKDGAQNNHLTFEPRPLAGYQSSGPGCEQSQGRGQSASNPESQFAICGEPREKALGRNGRGSRGKDRARGQVDIDRKQVPMVIIPSTRSE